MWTFHLHYEIYNVSRGLVSVTYPPEQWIIRGRLSWQETIHVSMLNVMTRKKLWYINRHMMIHFTIWVNGFLIRRRRASRNTLHNITWKPLMMLSRAHCIWNSPSKYIDWIIETLKSPTESEEENSNYLRKSSWSKSVNILEVWKRKTYVETWCAGTVPGISW